MTIYLTQGGDDETKVDEIEDKLKSAIPDLKRVSRVEDIDQKIGQRRRPLDRPPGRGDAQARQRRRSDRRRQAPSAKPVLHRRRRRHFRPGLQKAHSIRQRRLGRRGRIRRRKFSTLSDASAPRRCTMSRLNRLSWFRSRRAREASAIRPSRSKPPSNWSKTSQTRAPRSRLSILISSQATCATISTSRPSFSLKRLSPPRTVSTTTC